MGFMQKIVLNLLPKSWTEAIITESKQWIMRCTCGFERSIWEMGGIRYKATGQAKRLAHCPQCGQRTWHTLYHQAEKNKGAV